MVGVTGFEPATSCSRNRRATRLRHTPTVKMVRPLGVEPRRVSPRGFEARASAIPPRPHVLVRPVGVEPTRPKTPDSHSGASAIPPRALLSESHRTVLVGVTGFEPATPSPPDLCANQAALHAVISQVIIHIASKKALVRLEGFEPSRPKARDSESRTSAKFRHSRT